MYYYDTDEDINNRLFKLERLGLSDILHSDWLGFIIITNSGNIIIDCAYDYKDIRDSNIIKLLEVIKTDIFDIKSSINLVIPQDDINYNLIITPVEWYDSYRIFFISCSLSKKYDIKDVNIVNFLTNIGCENAYLNNEIVKERNYFQSIFDSTGSAIMSIDLQGNITKANKKVYDILGLKDKDISGKNFYSYLPEDQAKKLKDDIDSMIYNNESISYKDTVFVNKFENKIVLNIIISPLKTISALDNEREKVVGAVFVVTDVTKTKILEKELEQVKQIAVLGDISADIAHEIKNPLMGIRGCARILQKNIDKDLKEYEFTELIVTEVDRANKVIEQFLSYARMDKEDSNSLIDINEVLEKCSDLLYFYKEDKHLTIEKDLDLNLPRIRGNIVRLQQAFINILINSVEAVKSQGTIKIITKYLKKNGLIYIEILDTGVGIDSDEIDEIFDPYFTTKENGTGLGLPITKKIIKKSGGRIYVSSKKNLWTKFQIVFPNKEMVC